MADRAMREAAEILWPADELQHGRAIRDAIDRAGRPVPDKFARIKTPLVLHWGSGTMRPQAVGRPGTAMLIRARCDTAPSTGACTVSLDWESETVGWTSLGVVTIPPGGRFGEETVAAEIATLPAGAWVSATVTNANGATGVDTSLTINLS